MRMVDLAVAQLIAALDGALPAHCANRSELAAGPPSER
jgi:hypothetical protein